MWGFVFHRVGKNIRKEPIRSALPKFFRFTWFPTRRIVYFLNAFQFIFAETNHKINDLRKLSSENLINLFCFFEGNSRLERSASRLLEDIFADSLADASLSRLFSTRNNWVTVSLCCSARENINLNSQQVTSNGKKLRRRVILTSVRASPNRLRNFSLPLQFC